MVTARSERPRFFEGQYIGAADLSASVDYARELSREAALAGQSWGICIGLDLVEEANASGAFDYFILPGLAFDGFGRPIVVLSPAPVPAGLFADLPTGNQRVWLRYAESETRGLRPGWQSCDANDAYARVRESYAIEVGPMSNLNDRQSGVEVAGRQIADARLALNEIDPAAAMICDGSIPHQTFPADNARWLVPVGAASWTAGAPGSLGDRSPDARMLSRTLRRYVGQVAENLYAADGVLRLRDRMTDRDDTKSPDEQCAATNIIPDDLTNAPDPKDSTKTVERLVGRELVWVEGNMRITGDARLWGTKLELRDRKGTDAAAPLHVRRGTAANPDGGQDLEIAIGQIADGKTRLVAGVTPVGLPLEAKLQLKNDGRLAIGPKIPADVKSHTILAYTEDNSSIAIGTAAGKLGTLQFTNGPALTDAAHIAFDDATKNLRVLAGTDLANATTFMSTGHVGIRMDDPVSAHVNANDLVVQNPNGNVGLTLLSGADTTGNIHFADGIASADESRAGFLRYDHALNSLLFGTANAVRATIDVQGNLGIGTDAPNARVDIRQPGSGLSLKLNGASVRAEDGGGATRLQLQEFGGDVCVHGAGATSSRTLITGDGRMGLGTDNPQSALHIARSEPELFLDVTGGGPQARIEFAVASGVRSTITYDVPTQRTILTNSGDIGITLRNERVGINLGNDSPTNFLHVRGDISGDADLISSHVALIENLGGGDADVLALCVRNTNVDGGNNFITFFDDDVAIGRIERSTTTAGANPTANGNFLRLISGGADFAECLPRAEGADMIGAGRIVGVRCGRISLETRGADALMVTTDRAVVVGNAPASEDIDDWEHVAMIGQVPVFIRGPVTSGDYVLPSGDGDGLGRAVSPENLTPAESRSVVGRAWETCRRDGVRRVMVAIGVPGATSSDATSTLISRQAEVIASLEARISELASRMEG